MTVVIFVAVYAGMALGRVPGLMVDRTGIALLGALVLVLGGAVPAARLGEFIDWPTLALLFALMLLSAQFAVSGFYEACAVRITATPSSPYRLLGAVVLLGGALSAVLANDVVVFALTPVLCQGLAARGLDPRPYLIALAGAANAGSAATLIGNPQNILIGQLGALDFLPFLLVCAPPALIGLLVVYAVVRWRWRDALTVAPADGPPPGAITVDRWQLGKAWLATIVLIGLFLSPLDHYVSALAVGGALLVSRRLATRQMLGLVDWHLLILFAGLFVVTGGLVVSGMTDAMVQRLTALAIDPTALPGLAAIALLGSNTIGNVPLVMLLLQAWPDWSPQALYALAVCSTLAGNLLLVGSLANLIVVERAAACGVRLSFLDHARCGIPMTLVSLAFALAWLAGLDALGVW